MVNVIRISRGSKNFGSDHKALNNISLDIAAGERVALIGASGSGKSTLLRCLCGLETLNPDHGSIALFGQNLQNNGKLSDDVRQLRKQVSIIFQQFNLVGRLSVLSNVLVGSASDVPLWRSLSGRFPIEQKAHALDTLALVGLAEQSFQRASTLSGGQQQRAAVARALVQKAKLLLADEPVASLDPESTKRVMDLLLLLNQQTGMTLVISLHHVEIAKQYCERAVALRNGSIIFDGPTTQLTPEFLKHLYGTSVDELIGHSLDSSANTVGHQPGVAALALAK